MKFKIGKGSTIFMGCIFECAGGLIIGIDSVINARCKIDNRGGISIGNNVAIAAEVILLTADHDLKSPEFAGRLQKNSIEDFVWIGTRAMILPGVKLGNGAVVGAGSVVTKDVAPFVMVAGIPAKYIKDRPGPLKYETAYRRLFQ